MKVGQGPVSARLGLPVACAFAMESWCVEFSHECFVGEASACAKHAMDCLRLAKCDSFDGCVVIMFGTF